jgi:DNA-binding IclR family transcriptional regulator
VTHAAAPRRRLGAALQQALSGRPQVDVRGEERAPGAGLLSGEARARVFQALLDRPLLHLAGAARAAHLASATAAWHMAALEGAGLIERLPGGRETRFAVVGTCDEGSRAALLALRMPLVQPVLAAVAGAPGLSVAEVAREVGTSAQSVLRVRARMEPLGFLDAARDGRHVRLYPAEGLPAFLARRTEQLPASYARVEAGLLRAGETCQAVRRARGEVVFAVGRRGARREFTLRADGPLRPAPRPSPR